MWPLHDQIAVRICFHKHADVSHSSAVCTNESVSCDHRSVRQCPMHPRERESELSVDRQSNFSPRSVQSSPRKSNWVPGPPHVFFTQVVAARSATPGALGGCRAIMYASVRHSLADLIVQVLQPKNQESSATRVLSTIHQESLIGTGSQRSI